MDCCTESWIVTNLYRNPLPKSSPLRFYKSAKDNFHFISIFYLFLYFIICFFLRFLQDHVHYGDLILRVLDCIVTISFGVYLVLWLF